MNRYFVIIIKLLCIPLFYTDIQMIFIYIYMLFIDMPLIFKYIYDIITYFVIIFDLFANICLPENIHEVLSILD